MRKLNSLKKETAMLLSAVLALSPVSAAGPWVLMASADVGAEVATGSDYSYDNDDDEVDGDKVTYTGSEESGTEGEDADGSDGGSVGTDDGNGTVSAEDSDGSTEYGDDVAAEDDGTVSYSISDSDVTESESSDDTGVDAVSGADSSTGSLSVALTDGELTLETVTITNEASMAAVTVYSGTDGDISWVISDDGILTISGEGGNSYSSASKYPWYKYKDTITEVVVEEGVTIIGEYAFYNYGSLKTVILPESLESIEYEAFYQCSSLVYVDTGGVTSIDVNSFGNCENLETVILPDRMESLGQYAFYECGSLKSIDIPEGITSIGRNTFRNCYSLETAVLPTSLESIGQAAFFYCSSLTSIEIPEGVTSIGMSAFMYCESLKEVELPASLESIDYNAFMGCKSLEAVELPDGLEEVGYGVFCDCSSLTFIEIPEGVTSIGQFAFSRCESLETIILPASLESIASSVFNDTALVYVHYRGTEEQWSEISIGDNNDPLITAYFHYECHCTDCDCTDIESTTICDKEESSGEDQGDNSSIATTEDYTGSDEQETQDDEETEESVDGGDTDQNDQEDAEEESVTYYIITFDPNGGTAATTELETDEEGKVSGGTLPTAVRSGYNFSGWYTAASGGVKITASNVFTADITLYAHWTSKSSSSSSSGSGSSGGGNSTSSATIYYDGTTSGYAVTGSDGTTTTGTGSWVQTDMGWRFNFDNNLGAAADRWAVLTWNGVSSWYRFDASGYMITGWYTDPSTGYTYFLHDISDGMQGYMYTGWKQIGEKWYYFSETEGAELGRLLEESDTAPEG